MGGKLPYIQINETLLESQQAAFDVQKYGVAFGYAKAGKPNTPLRISKTKDFYATYGKPSLAFNSNFHYTALNSLGEAPLWCMRIANDVLSGGLFIVKTGSVEVNDHVAAGIPDIEGYTFGTDQQLLFAGISYGENDNKLGIRIVDIDAVNYTFTVEVYLSEDGTTYSRVESHQVSRIKEKLNGFGESMYIVDIIKKNSVYITVVDNVAVAENIMPKAQATTLAMEKGDSGTEPANSDIVTALENLSDLVTLNVFTFPDCGYTDTTVQNKIVDIVEAAGYGFALLSAPFGSDAADAISHKTSAAITSEFAAWYFPNTLVTDTQTGRTNVQLAMSSAIQKQYLNHLYGAFQVPMGEQFLLPGVLELILSADDAQLVLDAEINPIASVTGVGNYSNTENTSWPNEGFAQRISVRLLLNYIKAWCRTNMTGFLNQRFTGALLQRAEVRLGELVTYLLGQQVILGPADGGIAQAVCNSTNNDLNTDTLHCALYVTPANIVKNMVIDVIVTPTGVNISVAIV
jgi:hypothetical protein